MFAWSNFNKFFTIFKNWRSNILLVNVEVFFDFDHSGC